MITRSIHMRRPARRTGFTLVELAIVLVIIGLIIGGVLTAQQITQNAKTTSAIQQLKSVQAAAQSYNQNYGAWPGDDASGGRFGNNGIFNSAKPDGNNIIGVPGGYNKAGGENLLFWSYLRAAKLIKGDPQDDTLPLNPFGGVNGVQDGAFGDAGFSAGTNTLCMNHLPGSAAQAIDQQLDDGKAASGSLRATPGDDATGTVSSTEYNADGLYVLCTPL